MKKGHWTDTGSFIDAWIGPNGAVCASVVDDELAAKGFPHAQATVFFDDQWLDGGALKWDVRANTRCAVPFPQYVVIGVHGKAQFIGGGDIHEETIEDGTFHAAGLGQIRGARTINGYLYVCGMNRQVYKRQDANHWKFLSEGLLPQEGVFGFESLDGFAENEIYAVGWEGEIWQYDGSTWQKRNSGTTEILTKVVCGGDGQVYALSRGRKLVVGRNDSWKVIDLAVPFDIRSIAWFEDRIYACSSDQLFEWNGSQLVPVEIPGDKPQSMHQLNASEGKLCVIGPKDLFVFSEKTWTRID